MTLDSVRPTDQTTRRVKSRRLKLWCGGVIIAACYLIALGADFIAPYDYRAQARREPLAPAAEVAFCPTGTNGRTISLCLFPQRLVDPLTRRYAPDDSAAPVALRLFARGDAYRAVGLFPTDWHLFGAAHPSATTSRVHLLGTDYLGRDRFSRLVIAARFSLVVGPLATLLASALGTLIGCWAGYAGRTVNAVLMRTTDVMLALPTLIVILVARAVFPLELPPLRAGILLISIFTVLGWAEMARIANNLVLALRRREFILAAESLGLSRVRVLFRHILPNAAAPLVVQAMLLLPTLFLAETTLSFLGVGLQEPVPSWGNMLAEARDLPLLRAQPFLLLTPALAIMIITFGFRLIASGMRRD